MPQEPRHITRYTRRHQLWDNETHRYTSLNKLGNLIERGHEIRVTQFPGDRDVTNTILLAIAQRRALALSTSLLHRLVRAGGREATPESPRTIYPVAVSPEAVPVSSLRGETL